MLTELQAQGVAAATAQLLPTELCRGRVRPSERGFS
jgi:hypothetical protein